MVQQSSDNLQEVEEEAGEHLSRKKTMNQALHLKEDEVGVVQEEEADLDVTAKLISSQ